MKVLNEAQKEGKNKYFQLLKAGLSNAPGSLELGENCSAPELGCGMEGRSGILGKEPSGLQSLANISGFKRDLKEV